MVFLLLVIDKHVYEFANRGRLGRRAKKLVFAMPESVAGKMVS